MFDVYQVKNCITCSEGNKEHKYKTHSKLRCRLKVSVRYVRYVRW